MYKDGVFQVVEVTHMYDENQEPEKNYQETIEYLSNSVLETFCVMDKPSPVKSQ